MEWLAELVSLLAPPACVACRAPLVPGGEVLCAACRRGLPWLRDPRCERCGLPAHERCPATDAAFAAAWAPLAYEGTARAVVTALKFSGRTAVVDAMAAQMLATAPRGLLDAATLVPAPLHPARRRRRGFDQAERLARALAKRSGMPLSRCLRRMGGATTQVGAGRSERLAAGRIQIEARGKAPARVLLIDDVHTTGATLDACATALRKRGARHVAALTYARTLA